MPKDKTPKSTPATRARKPQSRSRLTPTSADTRASLVIAAQKQFAANGYKATSVHEIANQAGVNVSLVSYHFGNKEGLFKACLENAGTSRLAMAERILSDAPTSIEDIKVRLSIFIEDMLLDQVNNPEICTILNRDLVSEFELIEEEFKTTFLKLFQLLAEFFNAAKSKGIIATWIDPKSVSILLMGAIIHVTRTDHIRQRIFGESITDEVFRRDIRDQIMRVYLEGISMSPKDMRGKGT